MKNSNGFNKIISGIKKVSKRGGNSSVANIFINRTNIFELNRTLRFFANLGIKRVDLNIINRGSGNMLLPMEDIANEVSKLRYRFMDKLILRIKNLPYCLMKRPEGPGGPESIVYFGKKTNEFVKLPQCKDCKYGSWCNGILTDYADISDLSKIKPTKDLPREIMIEVEPRCNLDCKFCFNKNSFAEKGRNIKNKLSAPLIKKIIDNIAKVKIPIVRFTGGEPLLREDIWGLAQYAKNKGLEVRLNTNGILIKNLAIAKKVISCFDNILLPIQYNDIFNRSSTAKDKIRAIKLLKKAGAKVLRIGTVATREVIHNLERIHHLIESLPIDRWELYRAIATPNSKKSFTKKNVVDLVEGLIKIKRQTGKTYYIINAIPFCSYDPIKIQAVALGADAVDGHERFVIDPRGFAKPIYYMDKNIGSPIDILSCWNHPFMKNMRSLKLAPAQCKKCIFLEKCRGGCRFSAKIVKGSYNSPDPLMDVKNIIFR